MWQFDLGVKIHTHTDLNVLSSDVEAIVQSLELLHANGGMAAMAQRSQDSGHALQIG